jgi:hypothetical protein
LEGGIGVGILGGGTGMGVGLRFPTGVRETLHHSSEITPVIVNIQSIMALLPASIVNDSINDPICSTTNTDFIILFLIRTFVFKRIKQRIRRNDQQLIGKSSDPIKICPNY